MKDEIISFSTNGQAMNTVFGLTSTKSDGSATISDISFYTRNDLVTRYPEMQKHLGLPDGITATQSATSTHIYSLNGTKMPQDAPLTHGIYIVNGEKRLTR